MNPSLKAIIPLFSYRKELTYILVTFLFILLIPILSIIIATNTGIEIIADRLASINVKTHKIEIHDPTGKVISEINVTTTWPTQGTVTLEFGEIDLPYQPLHTGIDIAGKTGDPITSFMKGTVTYAGEISWGYGKHIIIDHGNNVTSLYGHLSAINVKKGDEVKPGDVIGLEGSTGWATGPHLHFEIRVFGIPVNPKTFINTNP